jgi:hypothetical protein
MSNTFSKVVYDASQAEIAKVNRVDKTLYLNPDIWKGLPADQKEFVLLHEKGHLVLQTTDEFEANEYAVKNFAPVKTLTNGELGKRIVVMKNILTPRVEAGFAAEGIAGALSGIMTSLPVLGIGSKARQQEAAANATAQMQIITVQSAADSKKSNSTMIVVVMIGVLGIVGLSLYLILKK